MATLADRIRPRSVGAAILAALALVLMLVVPSEGEVPKTVVVESGRGLTEPGGLVRVNGQLWVADGELGVCRVDPASTGPSVLIEDTFCQPEADIEGAPPRPGPPGAVGLSYDPVSSNFYVGDPSSSATGVWKLHLDTVTGQIDSAAQLPNTAVDRITGLALADEDDDGVAEVYFSVKRTATIYRIVDPAGSPSREVAGLANDEGPPSLATLDTGAGAKLFLAEPEGITELDLTNSIPLTATPVPGFPVGVPGGVPNALAVDASRNRLYAGTMNENGVDQVDAFDLGSGEMETLASGFSAVSSLLIEGDGSVLVGDDPTVASGAGATGQARIFSLPLTTLNLPRTTIDAAPPTFTNQTTLTFDFSSRDGTTFECRFDGSAWAACGGVNSGSVTHPGLGEGAYVFEVRATDLSGTGPEVRRTVVVDLTAPTAAIENPESDRVVDTDRLTMRFSAGEQGVRFSCVFDGRAPEPCDSPFWLRDLALGDHVFSVTPTDFAGNVGAPAEFAFTRVEPPPPPAGSGDGGDGNSGGDDNSGPGGGGDSSGSGIGTPRTAPDAVDMGRVVLRARVATLSRTRVRRRQLRSRPIGIAFNAPGPARYARITIQPYGRTTPILSQRANEARILMRLTAPVQGGRRNYIRWKLTRGQARRLKAGRYRVTIALGQDRRSYGPQKVLTMRVLGRG